MQYHRLYRGPSHSPEVHVRTEREGTKLFLRRVESQDYLLRKQDKVPQKHGARAKRPVRGDEVMSGARNWISINHEFTHKFIDIQLTVLSSMGDARERCPPAPRQPWRPKGTSARKKAQSILPGGLCLGTAKARTAFLLLVQACWWNVAGFHQGIRSWGKLCSGEAYGYPSSGPSHSFDR